MQFISVMFASPAYDEMVQMRIQNLYEPLGASIELEDFATEYKNVHMAIYNEAQELIGGFLAEVIEEDDDFHIRRKIALLKQVVIKEKYQNKGFGTQMLEALEQLLIDKGYKEIRLNAHLGAMDYYAKQGYKKHGKKFSANNIDQQVMKKKIQKKSDNLDKLEAVGNDYD